MTVGTLLDTMTSRELVEWKAYFDLLAEEQEKDALAHKAKYGLQQNRRNKKRNRGH